MFRPNTVEKRDGYYVSYNKYDISIYGYDTTAIVVERTSAFLILNGDHRKALKGLSLKEACKYFHKNSDKKNNMSDDHEDDRLVFVCGRWKIVNDKK